MSLRSRGKMLLIPSLLTSVLVAAVGASPDAACVGADSACAEPGGERASRGRVLEAADVDEVTEGRLKSDGRARRRRDSRVVRWRRCGRVVWRRDGRVAGEQASLVDALERSATAQLLLVTRAHHLALGLAGLCRELDGRAPRRLAAVAFGAELERGEIVAAGLAASNAALSRVAREAVVADGQQTLLLRVRVAAKVGRVGDVGNLRWSVDEGAEDECVIRSATALGTVACCV